MQSLSNHRGFFSDYWLGTALGGHIAAGVRLTAAQLRTTLRLVTRLVDAIDGGTAPDLTHFRERFARPLLQDFLGFELQENPDAPRLRALSVANGGITSGAPVAMLLMCPDPAELESRSGRKQLEDALLANKLDYGLLLTPEVLRLIRRPTLGARGAAFDLRLATAAELQDGDSLATAYRVLSAGNFKAGPDGARPIDLIEAESRRHSAKVSTDLKAAVFEAAERIVAGFLEDLRERSDTFTSRPSLVELRDAGFLALYRLLFILYAEARDERLIGHKLYQRSYSLDHIVARLLRTPPDAIAANRYGLWMHLAAVFRIFNEGIAPNLPELENIPPRGGRLFSEETPEGRLLLKLRLNDRQTAAILRSLASTRPRRGVGRERVSFRELEIEHLGAVYEGLLEYEPAEAAETLLEVRVAGRELALTPLELVQLCEHKSLHVSGDPGIVEGTAAALLHPDLAMAEEEPEEVEGDEIEEEEADPEGEEEPAISRGAALRLTRRFESGTFFFKPGPARKSSGSYYTPTTMVDYLVREALGPLVERRRPAEIERLRVIDIACGSGHFLVGAARFLGAKLFEAHQREQAGQPPTEFHPDRALTLEVKARWETEGQAWCKRRIVERCLFGVDLNPAAVQLAQVALWIESLAGDRPLSFFAHHIRNGNSLLGSSFARFDAPPDRNLTALPDRHTRGLFEADLKRKLDEALIERRLIDAPVPPGIRADTAEEYAYKEDRLRRAESALTQARLLLDLRSASPLLPEIWRDLPLLASTGDVKILAHKRLWWPRFVDVRERERFFHWELEFPEIFLDRKHPGFDAVLGNPPWDKVLPNKHEFYGRADVLIRAYKGNELNRRIRELHARSPALAAEFNVYRERATTIARVLRSGGDFPLSEARTQAANEDTSKYFVDRALSLLAKDGAAGLVVPSVFYNGDGWVGIRRYLLKETTIERFYSFENRKKIFPIHSSYKFVNLVIKKSGSTSDTFTAAFMRHDVSELESRDSRPWEVRISRTSVADLSPKTLAFLEYRGSRDQEIIRKMHSERPTLASGGNDGWGARFLTDLAHDQIYHASKDKDLFTDPNTGALFTPQLLIGGDCSDIATTIERMAEKGFWPVYGESTLSSSSLELSQFDGGSLLNLLGASTRESREPREPSCSATSRATQTSGPALQRCCRKGPPQRTL
ncbi:MAG: N-6 DNA methylase [Pseudomonadota bacterium]|nr:N-6 DNA methylase [Pseudomonadota bacterium]